MQVIYTYPDEFGNPGGELFLGQSHGFTQNSQAQTNLNPGNGMNPGGLSNSSDAQPKRRGRGFASMDPQRVSEIASMGGKAAHQQGVAHEWTPDEARRAGRKGGQASRGNHSVHSASSSGF